MEMTPSMPWAGLPVSFPDILFLGVLALISLVAPLAGVIIIARRRGMKRSEATQKLQRMLNASTTIHALTTFAAACLLLIWWRGASWSQLGFVPVEARWYWQSLAILLMAYLLVFALVFVAFHVIIAAGKVPEKVLRVENKPDIYQPQSSLFGILSVGVLVPVAEEVVFRGVLYGWLRFDLAETPSVIISAVVFGLAHGIGLNGIVGLFMGAGLGILYESSGSILPGIVVHSVHNILSLVLLNYLQKQLHSQSQTAEPSPR